MLVLTFVIAGCKSEEATQRRKIMVSIEPLRYFAENLAGPQWEVSTFVPQGFSPEEFTPAISQMVDLSQACCLFEIGGLGVETTWLKDATRNRKDLYVCDTSQGIASDSFDPHTWTTPANALIICRNITQTLITLDKDNTAHYTARLKKMEQLIDSTNKAISSLTEKLPSRAFVIAHPALSSFARQYNLQQIAIENEGKEPTPQSIKQLISQARAEKVKVVFVQQEFSENSALVIARETGAEVVTINPLSYHWPEQLLFIAKTLKYGTTKTDS